MPVGVSAGMFRREAGLAAGHQRGHYERAGHPAAEIEPTVMQLKIPGFFSVLPTGTRESRFSVAYSHP